ncbi:MAG: SDR family NAD(P)-dependent oxidoreductase [Sphingomonas sp.]
MDFAAQHGPWAVIAGASEGTGRALARRIAAAGVPSILIARRQAPLDALAAEIRAETGLACLPVAIDLAQPDAFARIVDAVGAREVGLFVSNAGADPNGARFLDRAAAAWIDLVQRNAITMMRCCHHFAAPMRARGRGGLLLINSGACYGGSRFMAAYSASKAFTLAFAEGLWDELREANVHVLTLVMHMTDTPALRALLAEKGAPVPDALAGPDEVAALGLARLPHGPVQNWGMADDEAGFVQPSAADRRRRAVAIGQASGRVFGEE